jgi:hypothetical protein
MSTQSDGDITQENADGARAREGNVAAGICVELATLPTGAHLDASALARILGRCTKSVQRAARRGELPPPIKFMGRHVWMAGAVQEHFAARQEAALVAAKKRDQRTRQEIF